jgi:hypothetical protein
MKNIEIEQIENKYLNKIYYFLKYVENEMLDGFKSKDKIKDDWKQFWGKSTSDFATGAERIVYALLNGRSFGTPNSNPVSSDMFFEVSDAFIHLDMKTVLTSNIGDFSESIFIGENQNSYKGIINKQNGTKEKYTPNLPCFYNKGKSNEKICLTYFITILSNHKTYDIEMISIICMPNGQLESFYKSRPLRAGKNPGKARMNLKEVHLFELLNKNPKRIYVSYFNPNIANKYKRKLKFYFNEIINK